MGFCSSCGTELVSGAAFCSKCGQPTKSADVSEQLSTPGPGPVRTSGLAIASLVLGLLWLSGLGSLLAVIFGTQARRQMRNDPGLRGAGLATAGIVLGWVGVSAVALLFLFALGARTG